MRAPGVIPCQRGAVLVVAMLMLLLMAVIATAVVRTNLLQLRMAGNGQAQAGALQQAMALVDAVLASPGSMPVTGAVGHTLCAAAPVGALVASGCDETSLSLDPDLVRAAGTVSYSVSRMAPLLASMPVMSQDRASSAVFYRAAKFEIRAVYDATALGQARAELAQGVLVRLAATAH